LAIARQDVDPAQGIGDDHPKRQALALQAVRPQLMPTGQTFEPICTERFWPNLKKFTKQKPKNSD
jgi:hypothetical protein